MAAPSGCRPWVGVHGPAIPTRKETLNPNQQPGKWGSEERHVWHPADGATEAGTPEMLHSEVPGKVSPGAS